MLSLQLELDDGGTVIYDNVVSYTVEESEASEPSPDEVPEEGEEEREGNTEVDMTESEDKNPMSENEEENN